MRIFLIFLILTLTSLAYGQQRIIGSDLIEGVHTSKNFMKEKAHFEKNANGYSGYADAAATSPVDGTGGVPNVTCTRTTSAPLAGNGSFLITKDAVNRQGQGCSTTFSIDTSAQAKVLDVEFDYHVASGTFADNDMSVWVYDTTNASLIALAPNGIPNFTATYGSKFKGTFQTNSNSTAYRLIFHVGSTSASAYTVKIDDIKISPINASKTAPITDWNSYTPTTGSTTGFGTISGASGRWRRAGDSVEIEATFTAGTVAASSGAISLPTGLSINTSKLSLSATVSNPNAKVGVYTVNGATNSIGALVTASDSVTQVYFAPATAVGTTHLIPSSSISTNVGVSSSVVGVKFTVPIAGWSSSVLTSDQTDTRIVTARVFRNADQTGINPNGSDVLLTFNTASTGLDTHAGFNSGASSWTAPISGTYEIGGKVMVNATNVLNDLYQLRVYVNGSNVGQLAEARPAAGTRFSMNGSNIYRLNTGDVVTWRFFGNGNNSASTLTIPTSEQDSYGNVRRISGPNQIAASESVYAAASNSSGQSIPDNVNTDFTGWTIAENSHGALATTGIFTAPISGQYEAFFQGAFSASASGTSRVYYIFKNGGIGSTVEAPVTSAVNLTKVVVFQGRLNVGDTLKPAVYQNTGGALTMLNNANNNKWIIKRIGN